MENKPNIKKEKIVKNSSNNEIQPLNNENTKGEEMDNNINEIKALKPKKIILNKNNRNLRGPNQNDKNENEFVPNIEIEVINDNNNSKELINNNIIQINEGEIFDNSVKNKNEKNNEQEQNEKREGGYLDDDLDDEENKKIYLRVIKRMEKTYGVPVEHAKIPGDAIKDIGIEENIRPILINNNKADSKSKQIQGKENINNDCQNKISKNINTGNFGNNNTKKYQYENPQRNININKYNIPNNQKNYNYNNYNYKINNNKGTNQYNKYINNNNPINYNKEPNQKYKYNYNNNIRPNNQSINTIQNNYKNNINRPQQYNLNPSLCNKTPQYRGYAYQRAQNNIPNRSLSSLSSKPYNNSNSRIISNQKSNVNPLRDYSYDNPRISFQRKYENIIQKYNNNINTRYNGYLNHKINKIGEDKYNPLRQENYYYNGGQSLQSNELPGRNNNFNHLRKTYYICSNKPNVPGYTKWGQNSEINKIKKNNGTHYLTQSLINKRNPIIPKKANIHNYKENILKNRYYSPSENIINKRHQNNNNIPFNKKSSIPMIKSQKNFSVETNNYLYNRNSSQNHLSRSEFNSDFIAKQSNIAPANYLPSEHFLNYDYWCNYGNEDCFTYYIN